MLIDIKQYAQSFHPDHIESVIQFLDAFDCCEELLAALQEYDAKFKKEITDVKRAARKKFDKGESYAFPVEDWERPTIPDLDSPCMGGTAPAKHGPHKPQILEPPRPQVVVGFCPKCSSTMVGEAVPHCESNVTNRHFYSECTVCTYYTEIFRSRKNRFIEIKGG